MTCIKCRKAELTEQAADVTAEVKGETVLVSDFPALVCAECGYKTIHGRDMQEYMRAASDAYRRKHSLLTSVEICERRERLNKSQEEFARYLDVGVASIKRWELGQVQDRAMDRLIRISTDLTEAFHNFKTVEKLVSPIQFWVPNGTITWRGSGQEWQKANLKLSVPERQHQRHRPVTVSR
jgi:putative zinc finger/helix-turn-helix YgiT family protein